MTSASEIPNSFHIARALELFQKYRSGQPPSIPSLTPEGLMSNELALIRAQQVCECDDAFVLLYDQRQAFDKAAFDLISMQLIRAQRLAHYEFGKVLIRVMGFEEL
jgi:hypothetical protein